MGIFIALLTTSLSVNIYNEPYNYIDTDLRELDFSSTLTLSNNLRDASSDILFIQVFVGNDHIRDETGGSVAATPYFINDVSEISILIYGDERQWDHYLDPVDEYWKVSFRVATVVPNSNIPSSEIDPSVLDLMHRAFYQDVSEMVNLQNITDNSLEEISIAQGQEHVDYWEIRHIYRDGTMLQFNIWGDIMIFQYYQLTRFRRDDGLIFGPVFRDRIYPTYKAHINGDTLPNYVDAVNTMISLYAEV